ncbi:SDR family oxidoreductase [Actinopolymorpha sp. B17G11]|uniref:SDR family NAD(P)-dependent oxidoreductase n=1 Tax=Actinopolymorpha sp. B17G11 TaxID=3160861 RepID=UPI0032E3F520
MTATATSGGTRPRRAENLGGESRDFDGMVAVVTGGSTGIGRAVVDRLAAGGASVVYCSHDPRTVTATDVEGVNVTGVVADVRSADDMRRLMSEAVERHGGLDILVCSAGIQTYGTAEDTTEEDWHAVLDVNLSGIYRAAKFAIPLLRERGGGTIVAISSVQGRAPARRVLGYSVSKAGVDALVRSMAVDHASDRIRVNAVAPGPVDTPLLLTSDPGRTPAPEPPAEPDRPADLPDTPQPRIARAEEIAEVVAFLASRASSYVTGATYAADGGMAASQGGVLTVH